MRTLITILLTFLFILSYNAYVILGYTGIITDNFTLKVLIYFIFLCFYMPISVMGNHNNKSKLEIEFRKFAQIVNTMCVLLIIANNLKFINNAVILVLIFNGLVFVILCLVLIKTYKHGYFNNKYGLV